MDVKSGENSIVIISKCIAISNDYEDPLAKLSKAISFHLSLPEYQNILELLQVVELVSIIHFFVIFLIDRLTFVYSSIQLRSLE
jgi:hypothetical protein